MNDSDYKPLSAYGAIGSMCTAALVGSDGSVDWLCLPELDSPSVFAALLDAHKGGRWRIGPLSDKPGTQRYLERTNVLETTFVEPTGTVGVIDFMPFWEGIPKSYPQTLVRIVEGHIGEVPFEHEFAPRFDYARGPTRLAPAAGGLIATGPDITVRLWSPEPMEIDEDRAVGRWMVRPGDRLVFVLRCPEPGHEAGRLDEINAFDAFNQTVEYWRDWVHDCNPDLCPFGGGPWHDMVLRSELVLKLLEHHETGGIAAALTTSLPEEIGGERNWDYRYAWIRDASFTVHALYHLGHHGMLHDFIGWIQDSALHGNPVGELRVLYTLDGETPPEEHILEHLEGYRGSRPVRVGNKAAEQQQLDIYGEILDAAYQVWRYDVETPDDELSRFLAKLADHVCDIWHNPDNGIWEVRTEPRHFVYSKVMCWVALDRAVRLAEEDEHPLAGNVERWKKERQAVRDSILENGVDSERGIFVQSYGSRELDASLLLIPILGFLPIEDPRVERTIEAIENELVVGDLVIRYLSEDGLLGIEGGFAWCTFWLIDCMAMQGRHAEAEELFRNMLSRANPVGLMSEEIHLETGQLLGNFPQAFTHLGVINSALFLNSMKGRVEEGPAARPGAPV
ncbi:MAG: glycoside hydrolase family 15 protein [Gemmatimonadota bacterium]